VREGVELKEQISFEEIVDCTYCLPSTSRPAGKRVKFCNREQKLFNKRKKIQKYFPAILVL
jgi:hypothetical protein